MVLTLLRCLGESLQKCNSWFPMSRVPVLTLRFPQIFMDSDIVNLRNLTVQDDLKVSRMLNIANKFQDDFLISSFL